VPLNFPPHPDRAAAIGEAHARPPLPIDVPSTIHLVVLSLTGEDAFRSVFEALFDEPMEGAARHTIRRRGAITVKWERHTEFASLMITQLGRLLSRRCLDRGGWRVRGSLLRVGVGKQGFEWTGTEKITRKAEWPSWRPPAAMIAREAKKGRNLPTYMPGGPENPLGARALYLGSTLYRIHGTNQPWSIGQAVASGCITMRNEDLMDLYTRVAVGATVIVR